ncbi:MULTISPECIES: ribonuclease toxin immunity protein CdiI [Bacillus]|uniref:ribonuclease toxin immunity protein CdiI n=1 Tax=Bacillus TaxID=1386 RepID=UPI000306B399|nr:MULTISPECIES: ribonuclease toxin immunity protein CdiI [Bacillus]
MDHIFQDSKLCIEYFKKRNLHKSHVIDVLVEFIFLYDFQNILKGFLKEDVVRRDTIGVVFSSEFDKDDEEYFGENKVLFYYGTDEDGEDIVTHEELYKYVKAACEFYIERHPEQSADTENLLLQIKAKYQES